MNNINKITKNYFLLLCFFLCWYSPIISEPQNDDMPLFDKNILIPSNEDLLIKNLKKLFIIEEKKSVSINTIPFGSHELLYKLIADNKLKDLSGIKSISSYTMREKSNKDIKYPEFKFQIWKFDNKDNAKLYCDVMIKAVSTDVLYEKPPKLWFLASDELYYFTDFLYNKTDYMIKIQNKIIECCFSERAITWRSYSNTEHK
jgi:hypothetical protein